MKPLLYATGALALVCLSALCLTLSWESHQAGLTINRNLLDMRLQISRVIDGDPQAAAPEDRAPLRRLLIAEVDSQASGLGAAAFDQVKQLRGDLFSEVANWRTATTEQITGIRADTLTAVSTVMQPANDLVASLKPTIDHAQSISAHADEATTMLFRRDALPAQILGTLGATKVTMGQTALTMKKVEEATPEFISLAKKLGQNSDTATLKAAEAAEETRRLLWNMAENTTPLPKWLRYPLQVVGLVGTAAVPVITVEKLVSK